MSNAISYKELFEASLCIEHTEQWTKDTLADVPVCRGVLLFANHSGRPIQLLQAANLRRTALAKLVHEQDEPARRKADVSNLTGSVHYTCCYNNFLTQLTYTQLAHVIFEKDSADRIQLPKVSLAAIDTDAPLPFFYVAEASGGRRNHKPFGLFPTRKTAAEFCEILNTVFVLCRNPALLNSGKETSCSYLQMQTCPGPCLDTALRDRYAAAVQQAVKTAGGDIETAEQQFQHQMQQASETMNFESAQRFKKKLDLLNKLNRPDFQHVHPLENLCFLHIDIGPRITIEGQKKKQQQLMWFKVTPNGVFHLGDFVPETENSISEFLDKNWFPDKNPLPLKKNKELLALLSLQLFRSQQSGTWIDCTNGIWKDEIITSLKQCFGIEFTTQGA